MRTEMRAEICDECGADREREWVGRTVAVGKTQPGGGKWSERWAPTKWVTLCDCDAVI